MSGHCPDCGNTMCICSELTDQKPREYKVKYLEPKLGCGMNRTFDPPIELIEKSAYTAKCREVEEIKVVMENNYHQAKEQRERADFYKQRIEDLVEVIQSEIDSIGYYLDNSDTPNRGSLRDSRNCLRQAISKHQQGESE